jgi:hypothetical protein
VGGRTRDRGQTTRGDAGRRLVAAPPKIGHRSLAGGELMRRPEQVARGGGAREREGARRGYQEDQGLTLDVMESTATAGEPRRRRNRAEAGRQ